MKTSVAAVMAMLVGGLIGCSSSEEQTGRDEQGMYRDEDTPMSRGGLHDDATRLQEDPVCGRTVSPWQSISEVYGDQSYYFHDAECAKKFKEDPQAFIPGGMHTMARDPVCGHEVNPMSAPYTEEYDHKKYFFDTKVCSQKFKESPTAFLPGGEKGRMAKDPVCGLEVNPSTALYTGEYDHKRYFFDTKDCAQKFKDNPHAYMPGGDDRPGVKEVR